MSQEGKLNRLDLIVGGIGVSPIPIAGEICSTIFLSKILRNTLSGDNGLARIGIAAATTGLMRMQLYTSLYAPLNPFYQKLSEYFQ